MGCYATIYATNFSAAGVQSLRQRSQNWTEYEIIGESEIYITFLRRGLWVSDRIKVFGTTENMDPEVDFRSELIYTNLVHSGTLGAVTSAIPFATWTSLRTQVPPLSWQVLATNIVRFNSTFFSITNWTNSGTLFQYNRRGLGQPWSVSVTLQSGISDLTTYIGARAYFLESSNVIDGVTLTQWRDNVVTPATLTSFTNGSVKTDAVGDLNADGFNERYGWYEVTASGSTLTFTLPVASGRQHWPAFRVYGLTVVTVSLNGSPQTVGNGYLADNLGDGSYLVQLMDSYSSDQVVTASSIAPPGQNGNFLHFLR